MKKSLLTFLIGCTSDTIETPGDIKKRLLDAQNWPQEITGELVIINVIADDTGIIHADGWIEPNNSDERIGIVFTEEAFKTIDLSYDPVGIFNILLGPPNDGDFTVLGVSKQKI